MKWFAFAAYIVLMLFAVAIIAGGSQRNTYEDRLDHEENMRRLRGK